MTALLSPDGRHRFTLTRTWAPPEGRAAGVGRVLFVMLNPSTADAELDDPTIRKCRGFAQRWGFAELEVVNLYSLRATKPADLWRADDRNVEESEAHVLAAVERSEIVVAAWGAQAKARHRAQIIDRAIRGRMAELCRSESFKRIGTLTDDGDPRHPLMLAYSLSLLTWHGYPR